MTKRDARGATLVVRYKAKPPALSLDNPLPEPHTQGQPRPSLHTTVTSARRDCASCARFGPTCPGGSAATAPNLVGSMQPGAAAAPPPCSPAGQGQSAAGQTDATVADPGGLQTLPCCQGTARVLCVLGLLVWGRGWRVSNATKLTQARVAHTHPHTHTWSTHIESNQDFPSQCHRCSTLSCRL